MSLSEKQLQDLLNLQEEIQHLYKLIEELPENSSIRIGAFRLIEKAELRIQGLIEVLQS